MPHLAVLLKQCTGLLPFELGNFNFANPVPVELLQSHQRAALVHKLNWVRCVVLVLHDGGFLPLDALFEILHLSFSLVNVILLLDALGSRVIQLLLNRLSSFLRLCKLVFQLLEVTDRVGRADLEDE